jgi:D-galactose 1-dehydrogenase
MSLSESESAAPTPEGKGSWRLGMVGLGHVSDPQLEALAEVPELRLLAACDLDAGKAGKLPPGVAFFQHPEEMFREETLDAVLVSTPNDQHVPVAREALRLGLDVLLEKPATPSLSEFDELAQLSLGAGPLLVVAFHAAFGREVLWFLEASSEHLRSQLGPLEGFRCGFHDPYVVGGSLLPAARSLGGSWFDSGINALSVVARIVDPERIVLDKSLMTRVAAPDQRVVQGSVHLRFPREDRRTGRGIIDTNWTLGLSCKITELFYADRDVVLHHSRQQVLLREHSGATAVVADFSGERARMTAHYVGVFRDFARRLETRQDNLAHARFLHALLFAADTAPSGSAPCR